jgi:hypothetical protein
MQHIKEQYALFPITPYSVAIWHLYYGFEYGVWYALSGWDLEEAYYSHSAEQRARDAAERYMQEHQQNRAPDNLWLSYWFDFLRSEFGFWLPLPNF